MKERQLIKIGNGSCYCMQDYGNRIKRVLPFSHTTTANVESLGETVMQAEVPGDRGAPLRHRFDCKACKHKLTCLLEPHAERLFEQV